MTATTTDALDAYTADLDAHDTDLDRLRDNACKCGRTFPTRRGLGLHQGAARRAASRRFERAWAATAPEPQPEPTLIADLPEPQRAAQQHRASDPTGAALDALAPLLAADAGTVDSPLAQPCDGCNADPDEPCRPGCLSDVTDLDEHDRPCFRNPFCGLPDRHDGACDEDNYERPTR